MENDYWDGPLDTSVKTNHSHTSVLKHTTSVVNDALQKPNGREWTNIMGYGV